MAAALCNPDDVKAIIDFDPAIEDLTPFIEAADELVKELCVGLYDTQRCTVIEKWLAAHFLAIRDPRYMAEHLGQEGVNYAIQVGLNLNLTSYGQTALALDSKGGLAYVNFHPAQGKRARPGIVHLGSRCYKDVGYPWRFFSLFPQE